MAVGPQTIVLKCNALSQRHDEANAAAALSPGDLIEQNASGNVQKHSVAAGRAEASFAKEDYLQGKTIADNYALNDKVMIHRGQKGDEIYAWVAANAAAIVLTDYLTPDGAGGVKKVAAATDFHIAKPIEALDNSAVGARARLRIRLM